MFLSRVGVSLVGFVSTVYFARELGAGGLGVYFAFETVVIVLGVVARFGGRRAHQAPERRGGPGVAPVDPLDGVRLVALPLVAFSAAILLLGDAVNDLIGAAFAGLVVLVLVGTTAQWLLVSTLGGSGGWRRRRASNCSVNSFAWGSASASSSRAGGSSVSSTAS